jgi:hypothetical protein
MDKKYWLDLAFKQAGYTFSANKITYEEFLDVISKKSYNLSKDLNISAVAISKLLKRTFPDRPTSNSKICSFLLQKVNKKICTKCNKVLDYDYFTSNSTKKDNKNVWCALCYRDYQVENSNLFRSYTAERRALVLQRSMAWGQEGIKEFYINCPKGYHVDHIIPLKGKNICGLHVYTNLQYLTEKDNQKKKNSYKY